MSKTFKFISSIVLCALLALLSVAVTGCVYKPDNDDNPPPPAPATYYEVTDATPTKHGNITWQAEDMDGTKVKKAVPLLSP